MKLLMLSGDRSMLQGKRGAFWYTLQEFSKHWERIDVVCPRNVVQGEFQSPDFPNVFFHPSPRGLWYQMWWNLRCGKELIAAHRHDVMTAHEFPPFYCGIGAGWIAKATGVPYCLEIHHIVGYPEAGSFLEWIGRWLSRIFLVLDAKRATAVRVVNGDTGQTLSRWGIPAAKIHIVPSFYLDPVALTPDPSIPKTYDLAFCGRLVANKGLLTVLKALRQLPSVTLLVIGDGPERVKAEVYVQASGMQDRITFVGWLPTQADVMRALLSAKIFVMNSTSEGGPRVLLEAMALGLPVLSTAVGIAPSVIRDGENGLLTTGEPGDLQQKISVLLQDDALRARLGSEAKKIIEQYNRAELIQKYAEFLQGMVR